MCIRDRVQVLERHPYTPVGRIDTGRRVTRVEVDVRAQLEGGAAAAFELDAGRERVRAGADLGVGGNVDVDELLPVELDEERHLRCRKLDRRVQDGRIVVCRLLAGGAEGI